MTKNLLLLFFIGLVSLTHAQYIPISSQGFQFASMYNPAFSGVDAYADIRLGYRYQWAGIEGAPKSANLSFNVRLRQPLDLTYNTPRNSNTTYLKIPRKKLIIHGFGLNVFQTSVGQIKTTGGSLNYAIHLPLSSKLRFALGVTGVVGNTKVDLNGIVLATPNDQYLNKLANGTTKTELNIRAGGLLYSKNFYIGVSYFPILQTTLQSANIALEKPFYKGSVQAGFSFALSPAIQIKPSIIGLMQIDNKFAIDYTIKAFVQNKTWAGFSYRDIQSGAFLLGFNVNEVFAVAYSYEMSLGTFKQFNDGSHELVLSLKLNNFKKLDPYTW